MKPVLLAIDLQSDFPRLFALLKPRARFEADVGALAAACREGGVPVIHVLTLHRRDRSTWTLHMKRDDFRICIEGTEGIREIGAIARRPGEPVFHKTRWSAFFGTDLDRFLRERGYDTLILAGFLSHACIRVTALDAYQRDYGVIIARDCIDTYDAAHEKITLDYLSRYAARVMANEELLPLIRREFPARPPV
ncbi:MAG: cysteine hydrolase [bacterium]|nr:cysteine hydrolase [bacterium]